MISAKEARKTVDTYESKAVKEEISRVENEILAAVTEGLYDTSIDGYLKPQTKKYLQGLGYDVQSGSQYNESYTTIKW